MLAFGDILSIKFRRRKVIVNTRKSTLFEGIFCNALSILYHTIRIISIRNFKIRGRRLSFLRSKKYNLYIYFRHRAHGLSSPTPDNNFTYRREDEYK